MNANAEPESASDRGGRRRREAAEHFRLMADSAPVMIWVADPTGKAVYFNRPWLEFTGRALERELGDGWIEGLHPDDRERTAEALRGLVERSEPMQLEYRLRRGDGEHRWLLVKGVPLVAARRVQGFVGSCVDITDRMEAEEAARKGEKDFKTLAENIPDVIVRLAPDLRCVYVNRALEQAFGVAPAALAGRLPADSSLPPEVATPITQAARGAFETRSGQHFGFQVQRDGQARHFAGRAIPESEGEGSVEAVLVVIYDVTAQAREEERRAEALARERSARADAESATVARDYFLSIVSHELRTPLNGIKTWTYFLDNQLHDADPSIRRAVSGIMIGVDQQVALIEDLLDLTRALSGRLALARQPMALRPVLVEAVEGIRAAAAERDLRIVTDYRMGDDEIHGDTARVKQIFVNLLSNAVKFTPPGGTIEVRAAREGSFACVEFRDNGVGIAPEFVTHLFDPFRQADQRTNRHAQGLGLGLALVQQLTALHGGRVSCESEGAGRGATFRIRIPLREGSNPGDAVTQAQGDLAALPSLDGIRVLVIDDQREARESLAAVLTQAGASVRAAESGAEALGILQRDGESQSAEVIVCDIAMPGEDGYATLKRIRAWEEAHRGNGTLRRPAVAISAFSEHEDRLRALSEGFQMHLAKPVAPAELMVVISSVARGLRA